MNLKELSIEDTKEVNGGIFGIDDLVIIGGAVLAIAATQIVSDWENFKRGFNNEPPIIK